MAYIDKSDRRQRTREIQRMLRSLAAWTQDPELNVALDGSYDEGTRRAVRAFQEKYDLEPTGRVNYDTWKRLLAVYLLYSECNEPATPLIAFPNSADHTVSPGDRYDLVYIIQIMINALKLYYDSLGLVPISGQYDRATENAIREFQRINGLDNTGVVDKRTWNRLAKEYNSTAHVSQ